MIGPSNPATPCWPRPWSRAALRDLMRGGWSQGVGSGNSKATDVNKESCNWGRSSTDDGARRLFSCDCGCRHERPCRWGGLPRHFHRGGRRTADHRALVSDRRAPRRDHRRPLHHGSEPGSADRCGALRPRRDVARDWRRPPEPPRYGDPSGRRRLCRRGPRTCRRQLSRQEIQRHIGELAPAPASTERGSGSAPRRPRFRPAYRHPAYRCHRALGRRLQRARLDRGAGRHVHPNPPLHPLP